MTDRQNKKKYKGKKDDLLIFLLKDNGRIVKFRWVKFLTYIILLLLITPLFASGFFYYLHFDVSQKSSVIQKELFDYQKKIKRLEMERDELIAGLTLREETGVKRTFLNSKPDREGGDAVALVDEKKVDKTNSDDEKPEIAAVNNPTPEKELSDAENDISVDSPGFDDDEEILQEDMIIKKDGGEKMKDADLIENAILAELSKDIENEGKNTSENDEERLQQDKTGDAEKENKTKPGKKIIPSAALTADEKEIKSDKFFVENFDIKEDAKKNTFTLLFRLRNAKPRQYTISGHGFLILKSLEKKPEDWLSLPSVKLTDNGFPTDASKGFSFSFSNYRTVKFTKLDKMYLDEYDNAVVIIYDNKKSVMLKKTYPLKLEAEG